MKPQSRWPGHPFIGALLFMVLCNAPLLLLGNLVFLQRALINVDYSLMGGAALLAMRSPLLLTLAVATTLTLDFIFSFSPAYHFSVSSVSQALIDLEQVAPVYSAAIVIAVATCVALVTWAAVHTILACTDRFRDTKRNLVFAASLFLTAAAAAGLDWQHGRQKLSDIHTGDINFASSTSKYLYTAIKTFQTSDAIVPDINSPPAQPGTLKTWMNDSGRLPANIILIVVESLGLPLDPELNRFQLEPLSGLAMADRVSVRMGTTSFSGSTVPGELRELCSIQTASLRPDLSAIADNCLPEWAKGKGYRTTAIHGFSRSMFSRNIWYRQLGFDQVFFAADISRWTPGVKRCGIAFNGICDDEAWQFVVDHATGAGNVPRFTYWLTLSAHLPLGSDEPTRRQASHDCSRHPALTDNYPVCLLLHYHRALFLKIAQSVSSGHFSDTVIILVGDHAPPFIQQRYRQRFSDNQVPFVVIDIAPDHPPDAKEQPFHE